MMICCFFLKACFFWCGEVSVVADKYNYSCKDVDKGCLGADLQILTWQVDFLMFLWSLEFRVIR